MPGFDNDCAFFGHGIDTRGLDPITDPVVNQMDQDGKLLIGSAAFPYIRANTLTAGTGVQITNGAGSCTIGTSSSVMTWSLKGASDVLEVGKGFICNAGAALSFSLPAVSAVGDVIGVALDGSTSWTITQAANQQIRIGSSQTTLGAGGSLASTAQGDKLELVCVTQNLRWMVLDVIGNITVI